MTELVLIRHGETDWNAQRRIQGHLDIPLNHAGLAQAEAIGERFRGTDIDVLVSSDLGRAMQTAAPISEGSTLPVLSEARLRERQRRENWHPRRLKCSVPERKTLTCLRVNH